MSVFKVCKKAFVERITLQIVRTMVGVTGELMRCHLCKCMLPTSISQKQFLHHVQVVYYCDFFPQAQNYLCHVQVHVTFFLHQVKHKETSRVEVENALAHLEKSRKSNPHLTQAHVVPRHQGRFKF